MEEASIVSEYAQDGTVDLKGKPILKFKSGGMKACFFIVVYEIFERMAYFGISSNLILYLTKELHQGTVDASNNVTNWIGAIWMTPVLGAFIADAWLRRYWVIVISSFVYFTGMSLLTLSVSLPGLKPPPCVAMDVTICKKASTRQLVVFYGALYMLAMGTGGIKPNIATIGADQFDDFDPKEKVRKLSFFNWWVLFILVGAVFAYTVLVYIQDNVSWTLGYGIQTVVFAISIVTFLAGTPSYRHKLPSGSPFTRMAMVIVAALRKWAVSVPRNSKELYEIDCEEYTKNGKIRIDSTQTLRFLNKACVITSSSTSPWMLCSVTQVEETKQMLQMIPIYVASFIPCTMLAQINTLFVKQGTTLNRDIGKFNIPPASLIVLVTLTMAICILLYDRFFVKIMRRLTKNPRGITLLQRMGIGLIIQVFVMIIASLAERYRLRVAKEHGVVKKGGQVPLSILALTPQFIAMGISEAFLAPAHIEFFYDQAPESMKSLGVSYSMTSLGIGHFLSSFVLSTVAHVTKGHYGHQQGWISNNLNASHLDYYYAFLAVLCFLNYIFYVIAAKYYAYRAEVSDSLKVLEEELKAKAITIESNQMNLCD